MTLYICHAWSPEKILKEYLARYQQKYPDITFSIKSYDSGFDGSYKITLNDIVISNEEKPIIQISRAEVGVSLASLLKESGDIHIKLDRVYSFENSHIFLEKEVDQLINDLSSQYEIISQTNYWKHETKQAKIILTEVSLESDNDIPGNEKVTLKTDVSYRAQTNLEFRLESEFDLASLVKEKELRGKHYIKLKGFKYRGYHSKQALNQTIKASTFLKVNGDLNAKFELAGELLKGEFSLRINKNNLALNNANLEMMLSGVSSDDLIITNGLKVLGGLKINGSWSFSKIGQIPNSQIEVKSSDLFLEEDGVKKTINLDVSVTDLIRYSFKTQIGDIDIDASNKVSLDLVNHESMIRLSSLENKKINKERWRDLLTKNYFENHFLAQVELNEIPIDKYRLSGDIIWSRDQNLGQAQVFSLETRRGSLSGRRVISKSSENCLFKLKKFPIGTLSWLTPRSWAGAEGEVTGDITCPNKDRFKLEISSSEIKFPVFSINDSLKESNVKMRYYKDDRFSSLKAIWDRGRVEKIDFKNKVYDIEGKREGTLMVLSLNKKELIYKEKNNQWEFQEVR